VRLADFGPYSVAGHVRGSAAKIALGDLRISAGRVDRVRISATGRIDDAFAASGLEVAVTVSAPDLGPLAEALGVALPDLAPVRIAGTLRNWRDGYSLDAIELTAKGLDLSGDVGVRFVDDRPRFMVHAAARSIDVGVLMPARAARVAPAANAMPPSVFPDEPLRFAFLRDVHGIFELSAARAVLPSGRKLDGVAASGQIGDGRLSLQSLSANVAGGRVAGNLEIEAGGGPQVSVSVDVRGVNLGEVLRSEFDETILTGGVTSGEARLVARGNSIRAMAASLTGEVWAEVGEGRVANRLLDRYAGDLLRNVLTSLNPLARRKEYSRLECGVARMWFRDGVVEIPRSVAFETEDTGVMSSGSIDLGSERLDIAVRPRAQRGLRIGFGQIAGQLVRVRGTLAEPRLAMDELGAAGAAARGGAAFATVGLSLLAERLVRDATQIRDPCRAARAARPDG
jgi:uncharacterized protein involved in outer membrane biogenesis